MVLNPGEMMETARNGSCRMNLRYKMAENVTWHTVKKIPSDSWKGEEIEKKQGCAGILLLIESENENDIGKYYKTIKEKHLASMLTVIQRLYGVGAPPFVVSLVRSAAGFPFNTEDV